jgi:processing peptidase subunit alpha
VKIASENTPGSTVTVGVYVDSGSKYEQGAEQGLSHLLERMAFKATTNRSHLRFTREVESIGANLMASASREQMSYTADCLKTHLPEAVELLADTVVNPKFQQHEVKAELARMSKQVAQMANNPGGLVIETLHSAAFKTGVGNQFIYAGAPLTAEQATDFVKANYTGPRVVVAASGVDHKALLSVAEPLFSGLPATSAPEVPSTYVGGDFRDWAAGSNVHIALGFEMKGGWKNLKNATTLAVLCTLMGGGGSFSAGGPGKGMYSRLYTRVLNKHSWMQNCSTFQSGYNDTGIVGLMATADAEYSVQMTDVMVSELKAVAAKGAVSEAELSRAKNATISAVMMNLESKSIIAEDIGRQILTYGERKSPEEFIADCSKVTAADIAACATAMLKSPLSMSALGNISDVPTYADVAKRF